MGMYDDLDEVELERKIIKILVSYFSKSPYSSIEFAVEEIMELLEGEEENETDTWD
jgi:hypothetical protein